MIKKVLFLYIFVLFFINMIITKIKAASVDIAVIFLYIILIYILFKTYKKTYTKNSSKKYTVNAVIKMFVLSCIIFICYSFIEYGYASFFIPNYSNTYKFEAIHIINGVFFTPIVEEIIFRGILLNQNSKKYSFAMSNIIQAFIFSLMHFDIYAFCFLFIFSIILGFVCKYLNIYCCMLIHSLNNLLVILSVIFGLYFIQLPKYWSLIIGIIFSIIMLKVLNNIKLKYYIKII